MIFSSDKFHCNLCLLILVVYKTFNGFGPSNSLLFFLHTLRSSGLLTILTVRTTTHAEASQQPDRGPEGSSYRRNLFTLAFSHHLLNNFFYTFTVFCLISSRLILLYMHGTDFIFFCFLLLGFNGQTFYMSY